MTFRFKHSVLLILWLVLIGGCNNLDSKIPEGDQAYSTSLHDSIEVLDSLVEVFKIKDPEKAANCVKQAFNLSGHGSSSCIQVKAFLMAGSYLFNSKPDSSFFYYAEALRLTKISSCREVLPELYYNLAMIWFRASDYRQALVFMDSALIKSSQNSDFKTNAMSCNMMGTFYWELGDTTRALEMFTRSFDIASRNNLHRVMGVAFSNMARTENNNSNYLAKLRTALGFFNKTKGCEQEIGMLYNNLGNHMANPDSAIFYLKKAADIGKLSNDHEVEVLAYNNMAYSYLEKRDLPRAKWCLNDMAIPIAINDNNHEWLANLYDSYSDVLMASGEGTAAAGYLKKAINAQQAATNKQSATQTRLLMALLDVKNKEITIRDHELEIRNRQGREQKIWLFAGILLFLLLLTGFGAFWFQVRNRMKSRMLETENAKKIIALEATEKNRVAMQLHDLIGPVRNIINRQIEELNIPDPVVRENILSKLQTVASTLRHLSHRMNSAMMEQLTFGELFATLEDDFTGMTDFPVVIHVDPACDNLRGEISGHIFFIVLELLTNAVKHVETGSVRLTISLEFGKLYLLYHDDGPGFDPKIIRKAGMGLSNIHDRVKLLKGKVHLTSSPGGATEWTISVSLPANG